MDQGAKVQNIFSEYVACNTEL